MTKGIIKFRHQYYKLALPQFTTIRGKAQFKRLKIGDVQTVETPDGTFKAKIVAMELKRVVQMDIPFLKADAEYPGFVINSRQDFVALLNSFRAPSWTQVSLDSELTVIHLKKL